jgi:membrane peptidoglycan carboxypeptidase
LKRDEDGNFSKIDRLINRRDIFLDDLHDSDPQKYTAEAIEQAKSEEIKFNLDWQRDPLDKASATLAAMTEKEAENRFKGAGQSFKNEPVRVYTNIYTEAQLENHQILREQLSNFAKRIGSATPTNLKFAGSIVLYDARKGNLLSVNSLELENGMFHLSRHAFDSTGQMMSEIKPFIYSYGLEKKKISLSERLNPETCRPTSGWSPEESDSRTLTLGQHLVSSNNLAPLCVLQKVGLKDFTLWWQEISGKQGTNDYRIANGLTPETNLSAVELARLFGMFVSQGKLLDSRAISRIYVGGEEFKLPRQNEIQAIQASTAKTIASQLQAVVNENTPDGKFGTARTLYDEAGLKNTGVKVFGKTGSGSMDFWCVLGKENTVIVIRLTVKTTTGEGILTQNVFAADTAAKVAVEVLAKCYMRGMC